jgi:hypothetical protein
LLISSSLPSLVFLFFNSDVYPFIDDIFSFVATLPPYIWLIVTSIICCYATTFAFSLLFISNLKLINTKAVINPTEIFSGGKVKKKTYSDHSSKSSQNSNSAFPQFPKVTVVGCRSENIRSEVGGRSESEKGNEGLVVKRGNIKTDDYHSKITGFSNPRKGADMSENDFRYLANGSVGELKEIEEINSREEHHELVTYNICTICETKAKIL